MSIGKRVAECMEKAIAGDPEASLLPICSALEATAKREYPTERQSGPRFKKFLKESLPIIGFFGLSGLVTPQLRVGVSHLNHDTLKMDADGRATLEDVLYHVVRCGLDHEATIAQYVSFPENVILGCQGPTLQLCRALPYGLVLAVVGSPANSTEKLPSPFSITCRGLIYNLDEYWGQRSQLIASI
jgi:hypothetical protein